LNDIRIRPTDGTVMVFVPAGEFEEIRDQWMAPAHMAHSSTLVFRV
jgi:hypothetical protein